MRDKCPTVLRKAVSLKSSKHFTLELKERTKRQGSYLGAKKERFRKSQCVGNMRKQKVCFLNPRSSQSIYRNKIFI